MNYSGNVRFSDAIQIPDMVDSYTFAQYFNRANTNDGGGLVFDEAALERIKNYQTGNTPIRTLLNTMERRPVMTENGKTIQVPSPTQTGLKSSIKIGYPQQSTI